MDTDTVKNVTAGQRSFILNNKGRSHPAVKNFFHNLNIRLKLLGGYTLIFILATLLGGAVIYSTVRSTIERNIERELTNSTAAILNMVRTAASTSIKNHLQAIAEKNKEILTLIHGDYTRGDISEADAKRQARRILFSQTIGKTGYLFCANTRGIAIEHPNPGVVGKNFMDHLFVKKMLAMKKGYLEYDWKNPEESHKRPKAMYMDYFEPWDWIISVSSYREEFKELIHISDFKKSILALKFGKTGYAYITDSKGNLIVHPFLSGNYFDTRDRDGQYAVRNICQLKNGKAIYSWKNPGETIEQKKMVIFNYIPEYDWIVASASNLNEIFSPLKTIRNVIVVTVGLIIVLVFATSLIINHTVVNPLKALTKQFAFGASGDLTIRMPVTSRDEIGQLACYFNNFMERLDAYSFSLKSEICLHQQTEKRLSISEEKYRTILERMEEGYFEIDLDGAFSFSNHSMEKMMGFPEPPLPGRPFQTFLNKENHEKVAALFRRVKHSGIAVQISELDLVKTDGSLCPVETSVSLITDLDHSPKGFSGVVRDISERKKNEKALRLSEEMFSKAFRSSPSGMVITTLKDFRMINVNDSFLKITRFSLFDLVGKELMALRFFIFPAKGKKLLETIQKKGSLQNNEIGFFTAENEKRTGVVSAEIVTVWGQPCLLMAMADITEQRQLEKEILNISERERRKIAMELHDDLCPQLIGIEVMIKLLKDRLDGIGSNEAKTADKIRTFIVDSIDKTRQLSRGLFPANLSEHGVESCLQALASAITDIYGINCRLDSHFSCRVKDPDTATHLYYIAHEAVHNAVKHATAKNIVLTLTNAQETVTLQIEDDGNGMENLVRTTGMGLKLMQYRAARIGGLLTIGPAENGGTHVELEFEIESCPRT